MTLKMAFLGQDGWKADLSQAQTLEVTKLEARLEAATKELKVKKFQFENTQQDLERQKRKVSKNCTEKFSNAFLCYSRTSV